MVWKKTAKRRLPNRPLFKNKVDLVLKNNFICVLHAEGKRHSSIFPNSNFYLFSITGKMVEIKSLIKKLEIDFYRTRKGNPPFKNA